MQIAYVLAYLTLDEKPDLLNGKCYAGPLIRDCLSLYHVIRSSGIIETSEDKTITYLGGHNIDSDALTPEIRTLYNELITKLGGKSFGDFKLDDINTPYSCPLTPLPEDLITPKMILILNNLLRGTYTVDKLPTYEGEFPITAERMSNWVMKGIQDGKPFVAIKMKHEHSGSESKYVVFLTSADKYRLNTWTQCPLPQEEGKEVPSFFIRDGVQTLLAYNGKLDDPMNASEDLKLIIQDGLVQDHRKKIWEVIGHPKIKEQIDFGPALGTLKTLLGRYLDTIHTYNGKDPITAENMTAPIMKGVEGGKPFIAIRLNNTSTDFPIETFVMLTCNEKHQWFQVNHNLFAPKFFYDAWTSCAQNTPFTDVTGRLIDTYRNNFMLLQTLIREGQGEDQDGLEWVLHGHAK
jgi:hypothetical protein